MIGAEQAGSQQTGSQQAGVQQAGANADDTVSICSLHVANRLYGIDTHQIREVLGATMPRRVPLAPKYIAGVVPYRGEVLTTVCFRSLLGLGRWSGAHCILVFGDAQNEEQFGLIVDDVGGVVAVSPDTLEENPGGLDEPSREMFGGAYKLQSGLMVRLDPQRLRPSRLAQSELFGRPTWKRRGGRDREDSNEGSDR